MLVASRVTMRKPFDDNVVAITSSALVGASENGICSLMSSTAKIPLRQHIARANTLWGRAAKKLVKLVLQLWGSLNNSLTLMKSPRLLQGFLISSESLNRAYNLP